VLSPNLGPTNDRCFLVLLSSIRTMPRLGHGRFPSNTSQLVIHLSRKHSAPDSLATGSVAKRRRSCTLKQDSVQRRA
jgi:hypothetical protein